MARRGTRVRAAKKIPKIFTELELRRSAIRLDYCQSLVADRLGYIHKSVTKMEQYHASSTQEDLCGYLKTTLYSAPRYSSKSDNGRTIVSRLSPFESFPSPSSRRELSDSQIDAEYSFFNNSRPISQEEAEAQLWGGFPDWQQPDWIGENPETYSRTVGYGLVA